jgi:hypothetical protein
LSLDGEARKLALIDDPLERDQQTKLRAGELKVKVALLRDRVAHYRDRGRAGAAPGDDERAPGRRLDFEKLAMASEPVVGSELLDDFAAAIRRHAFLDEHDVTKATLWTAHGHRRFHGNVQVLPRMVISAGCEDSGKTTLAVVLSHATDTALVTVSPRPANIFRSIEEHQVALFLDESDVWYPRNEDLREIVNSGFNKDGATVLRVEDVGTGAKRELQVRLYSTFTPMAIIGIGLEKLLARTLLSRALVIRMAPARVGEKTADIFANQSVVRALREIASRMKRWIADHEAELAVAEPDLPVGVLNRLRLVWAPLVAIADAAGGDWPRRARAALEAERGRIRDPSLAEQLLLDLIEVMRKADLPAMHVKDLVEQLQTIELRTWSSFGRRRLAIRDVDVAELLSLYGLRPQQLKIRGINRRGYRLEALEAAALRYITSYKPSTPGDRYPATDPGEAQDASASEVAAPFDGSGLDPLPELNNSEVAATSELGATDFFEENHSGSRVAPPRPPSTHQSVEVGDGASPDGLGASTVTLECAECGASFEHDAHKPGRRPSRCSKCRSGGARARATTRSVEDRPAARAAADEVDRVVDEVRSGLRCGYCGMEFLPTDEPVEIGGNLPPR